jgi:hypothetical protein
MGFTLRVADIATRVVCDDPGVSLAVSGRSNRFLVPDGVADLTIGVERAAALSDPGGDMIFDSGLVWRLFRERDEYVFSFRSSAAGPAPYRLARFNPAFTAGQIRLNRSRLPHDTAVEPLEYPLDELIMIHLLARGRGVEIHGCAVLDQDGAAYLFAGQSEAGKSTTARLWHEQQATVLSDDRVILRLRGKEVWVYGTPWHGEEDFASPASAPLDRIFFLEQGRTNGLREIGRVAAVAQLVACCFPPFHDKAGLDFTLELLTTIIDCVPCSVLTFVPEPSAVQFVRASA